jgi:hypothetical protein
MRFLFWLRGILLSTWAHRQTTFSFTTQFRHNCGWKPIFITFLLWSISLLDILFLWLCSNRFYLVLCTMSLFLSFLISFDFDNFNWIFLNILIASFCIHTFLFPLFWLSVNVLQQFFSLLIQQQTFSTSSQIWLSFTKSTFSITFNDLIFFLINQNSLVNLWNIWFFIVFLDNALFHLILFFVYFYKTDGRLLVVVRSIRFRG